MPISGLIPLGFYYTETYIPVFVTISNNIRFILLGSATWQIGQCRYLLIFTTSLVTSLYNHCLGRAITEIATICICKRETTDFITTAKVHTKIMVKTITTIV